MAEGDELILLGLRFREHNDVLRRIARILRSGEASKDFLSSLADHIDPRIEKTFSGTKLVVLRRRRGKPKALDDPLGLLDGLLLIGLLFKAPEGTLRHVAEILRGGDLSLLDLRDLADHIDPDVVQTLSGTKLGVKHAKTGAPKGRHDSDLGVYMYTQIVVFGESVEAVVASAARLFSAKRTSCMKALKLTRASCDESPAYREWLHVSAPLFRKLGEESYQTPR
jgi:hypothetical protein